MNDKRIWITWEIQRRNQSLSREVGAKLYELISEKARLLRYLSLTVRTISVIKQERPKVLFAQNPSIVLSLLVIFLQPLFRYITVIDEHNSGLFPWEGESRLLNFVARFIVRKADFAIVTNESLADHVRSQGGKPIVLPDPLPSFSESHSKSGKGCERLNENMELLFICTWSADEPFLEVLEAARSVSDLPINISITGNPKNKLNHVDLPSNVFLTGFIPDSEYVERLANSDAVIVLTTREDCLNCGAYEAVSLGKPGILSDTQALRAYFAKGFLFSTSDKSSITAALLELRAKFPEVKKQVLTLKDELEGEYANRLRALDVIKPPAELD